MDEVKTGKTNGRKDPSTSKGPIRRYLGIEKATGRLELSKLSRTVQMELLHFECNSRDRTENEFC